MILRLDGRPGRPRGRGGLLAAWLGVLFVLPGRKDQGEETRWPCRTPGCSGRRGGTSVPDEEFLRRGSQRRQRHPLALDVLALGSLDALWAYHLSAWLWPGRMAPTILASGLGSTSCDTG